MAGERHDLRSPELLVAGHERQIVHEARRRDDLVGGIASEIETPRCQTHRKIQRPRLNAV